MKKYDLGPPPQILLSPIWKSTEHIKKKYPGGEYRRKIFGAHFDGFSKIYLF